MCRAVTIKTGIFCRLRKWKFQTFDEWLAQKKQSVSSSRLDNIPNCSFSPIAKFINLFTFCEFLNKKIFRGQFMKLTIFENHFFSIAEIPLPHALRFSMKQNRRSLAFCANLETLKESRTKQNADIDHRVNADLTDK